MDYRLSSGRLIGRDLKLLQEMKGRGQLWQLLHGGSGRFRADTQVIVVIDLWGKLELVSNRYRIDVEAVNGRERRSSVQ